MITSRLSSIPEPAVLAEEEGQAACEDGDSGVAAEQRKGAPAGVQVQVTAGTLAGAAAELQGLGSLAAAWLESPREEEGFFKRAGRRLRIRCVWSVCVGAGVCNMPLQHAVKEMHTHTPHARAAACTL